MNSIPAHRAGRHMATPATHAPNAALLIDFDNVTLGVRSDLSKELRTLLNTDIIKGKVAVQRAYADWRRYPQYIVPLSESSVDLIFAPAFGTNKKNATDIRLAVDAIELVFTRPEIGTFILLSGDSDFSSLVLKLKEYGKYVIGVGIRESASDILIQNCDEYFSYSDLAGLTKEADVPSTQRDPWELVVEAVAKMAAAGDVMRSDRLKQVMQQLDPNFDEKNAGYNRFSKFVTDAGSRGLIKVVKQENGQFEVAPHKAGAPKEESRGRGGRGRGSEAAVAAVVAPTPAPAADGEARPDREERGGRRRRGRGRGRGRSGEEGGTSEAPVPTPVAVPAGLTLAEAFHLMSRALGELPAPVAGETLRARMAALHGKEDVLLEAARFPRLLRQANDAEVADVRMLGEDRYEVSPHKTDLALQVRVQASEPAAGGEGSAPVAPTSRPALRFRGGTMSAKRSADIPMVGVIDLSPPPAPAAEPVAVAPVVEAAPDAPPAKKGRAQAKGAVKSAAPKAAAPKTAKAAKSAAKAPKTAKKAAAKPAAKEKAPSKKSSK